MSKVTRANFDEIKNDIQKLSDEEKALILTLTGTLLSNIHANSPVEIVQHIGNIGEDVRNLLTEEEIKLLDNINEKVE